jgi:hypothetical protein
MDSLRHPGTALAASSLGASEVAVGNRRGGVDHGGSGGEHRLVLTE